MSQSTHPPGATYAAPPALIRQSSCSFRMASGTPGQLAAWLQQRGYGQRRAGDGVIRLERPAPAGERAIVLVFSSGAVLCQGSPGPRDALIALLSGLLAEPEPAGRQLELFGGVR